MSTFSRKIIQATIRKGLDQFPIKALEKLIRKIDRGKPIHLGLALLDVLMLGAS